MARRHIASLVRNSLVLPNPIADGAEDPAIAQRVSSVTRNIRIKHGDVFRTKRNRDLVCSIQSSSSYETGPRTHLRVFLFNPRHICIQISGYACDASDNALIYSFEDMIFVQPSPQLHPRFILPSRFERRVGLRSHAV